MPLNPNQWNLIVNSRCPNAMTETIHILQEEITKVTARYQTMQALGARAGHAQLDHYASVLDTSTRQRNQLVDLINNN